jgi:hypothetical protein
MTLRRLSPTAVRQTETISSSVGDRTTVVSV